MSRKARRAPEVRGIPCRRCGSDEWLRRRSSAPAGYSWYCRPCNIRGARSSRGSRVAAADLVDVADAALSRFVAEVDKLRKVITAEITKLSRLTPK